MTMDRPETARRNSDPLTSKIAANEITGSGKRQKQADHLLVAIRGNPGLTAGQLSNLLYLTLDQHQITRRAADLRNSGLAYPYGTAKYRGRQQQRWYAGADPNGAQIRPHCKTCQCSIVRADEYNRAERQLQF